MNINNSLYIFFSILIVSISAETEERKSFSVPLPLITTSLNEDGSIDEVFVVFGKSQEGWAIAPGNDRYVKDTRRLRMNHTYIEAVQQNWLLSSFEASLIDRVCESFSETLKILEKDLKDSRWDRCLYLDYQMPVFIRNFNYLFNAARNSDSMFPAVICVADSMFDTYADSPKSDERIRKWRENPEHILKMRITIRELIHQIEKWQQKELANPERDIWADYSAEFIKEFELFTRLYFNLPSSECTSLSKKVVKD